jgi:hypothetical protein
MSISPNINKHTGQTIPVIGFGRWLMAGSIDMLPVVFLTSKDRYNLWPH